MSRSKGGGPLNSDFVSKKEAGVEVPAVTCPGWTETCEFCDKRFGPWKAMDEDTLETVPQKPGFFMAALKQKAAVEVVDVAVDAVDLQRVAGVRLNAVKDRVADKKSKFTKAAIMVRWMQFKLTKDKDVVTLCAHWLNLGVLPRFLPSWAPLLDILNGDQSHFVFSDRLQKWCHPTRDAFWKKPKALPTKTVEVIEGCDWSSVCEKCDASFTQWRGIDEVVSEELAPDEKGIYMVGVKWGKNREVVNVVYDTSDIKLNIRTNIINSHRWQSSILKNPKFLNKNASIQVRWMEVQDPNSENSCFMYAHWLNSGSLPLLNHELPGEKSLDRHKSFVLSTNDKKWCYEVDTFRQSKLTKTKNRKQLLDELDDDLKDLNCEGDN